MITAESRKIRMTGEKAYGADEDCRLELKYRLHHYQYLQIRNALCPYMRKDKYSLAFPGKGYLVRSLYFDTYDYKNYYEKMDGNSERTKFRIRTYTEDLNTNSIIRVELKMRQAERVIKRSSFISRDQYDHFAKCWHWPDTDDPVLIEFERQLHVKTLRPQVMIEYHREGYETKEKNGLRITFDHKVKSAHADSLFSNHYFFREHCPGTVVMEIKFRDEAPAWVRAIVHTYGLKVIANSKFTQAIQAARHDLHHPDHVVVIR